MAQAFHTVFLGKVWFTYVSVRAKTGDWGWFVKNEFWAFIVQAKPIVDVRHKIFHHIQVFTQISATDTNYRI